MGLRIFLLYLLVCSLFLRQNEVEGYHQLSKEEDLEMEEQLKRLNKPAVKTIKTKYGDIYDCVDFYKQPAFDHPLLKNHNFHPKMRSTSIPSKISSEKVGRKSYFKSSKMGLEDGGCPIGTVPIRRTTKDDLIRAKLHSQMHASKINPLNDSQPGTHFAVARTKGNNKYDGVGSTLSVWNLAATAPQYTSGRIKITNGAESMEAGWTVNPGLYGNNRTHMYIYTNAGQSHCFNAQCGYVHLRPDIPVDMVIDPASTRGKQIIALTLSIYQDTSKLDWYLKIDDDRTDIGFWPHTIFTNLGQTATGVECGGEVFTIANVPGPGMGAGDDILVMDTNYDAFCAKTNIKVNNNIMNPPNDLELYSDNTNFTVVNKGDVGGEVGYLILYGGFQWLIGN